MDRKRLEHLKNRFIAINKDNLALAQEYFNDLGSISDSDKDLMMKNLWRLMNIFAILTAFHQRNHSICFICNGIGVMEWKSGLFSICDECMESFDE